MAKYDKIAKEIAELYDGKVQGNKVIFKTLKDATDGADDLGDQYGHTIDMDNFTIEFLNENIDVPFISRVCKSMAYSGHNNVKHVMINFGFTNESEIEGITAQLERFEREKKYCFESETGDKFYLSESQISELKKKDDLGKRQFLTHMGMRDLDAESVSKNLSLLKKSYPEMDDNGHLPVEGATSNESNENMTINENGIWMFGGINVLRDSLNKKNHKLMVNESNTNYVNFYVMSGDGNHIANGMYNASTVQEFMGNLLYLFEIFGSSLQCN